MGAPQGGDAASDDAKQLHSAAAKGLSADCIFQAWPSDRHMAAYRQLCQLQETTNDNVPGLVQSIDNSGSHLVRKGGQREASCACGLTKLTSDRPHVVVTRNSSGASLSIELSRLYRKQQGRPAVDLQE
ncbi:hypothetical protein BH10CYA1_BH10CYA1_03750 [soil metagenome]